MRFIREISLKRGITIILSLFAFFISLFKFFYSESPIRYTGGAELAALTTLASAFFIAGTAYLKRFFWERVIANIVIIVLFMMTLVSSYLLESWVVFGLMLIALLTWLFTFTNKNG